MALSKERVNELIEIYNGLKARIFRIEEQYSLDFVEPELDMPDSLNLTKLTYQPKSEKELKVLAQQQASATIVSKQASLDKNYNAKLKSLTRKMKSAQQWLSEKLTVVDQ